MTIQNNLEMTEMLELQGEDVRVIIKCVLCYLKVNIIVINEQIS